MKRLLFFATALLLCGAAVAGDKVVQSSSRRTPNWIGGVEEGYIIVSAEGATLELAKEKAITRVREQIVYAVGTRVQSATSITLQEITDNGTIQSHRELNSTLSVTAADIPYLADVSPSHADGYYWVKVRRKDKSEYYGYHLKYPLPDSKLRMLVADYEKAQNIINDSIRSFAAVNMAQYDDLSQMLDVQARLKQFSASLSEADSRRDICATISRNYDRMLAQNLHVLILESNRQYTTVALCYGDKPLTHAILPRVKSNCLAGIELQSLRDSVRIKYDYQMGCYEDEPNWLDIIYTVSGKKITARCHIR